MAKCEDVERNEDKRRPACAEAERRRVVAGKQKGKSDAEEECREQKKDIHALDAPDLAVAVISGIRMDNASALRWTPKIGPVVKL